jgi:hypothetical protein
MEQTSNLRREESAIAWFTASFAIVSSTTIAIELPKIVRWNDELPISRERRADS